MARYTERSPVHGCGVPAGAADRVGEAGLFPILSGDLLN